MQVKTQEPFFISPEDPPSKKEILKAALFLFARDGLCETSIRDIAEVSGYTNTALYKFFKSKNELAVYLFEACYRRLFASLAEEVRDDRNFEENLGRVVKEYTEIIDESIEAVMFVTDYLNALWPKVDPKLREETFVHLHQDLLRLGIDKEDIARDTDITMTVTCMIGTLTQFARMMYHQWLPSPAGQWHGRLTEALLRMVRRPDDADGPFQ